ncbi:MAG TPA: glutamine synthetase family protein [Acidimicrobiales bacterium]|nr:glutamine synthetase family protein [Acidimicrobiales bacterium]
MPGRELIDAGIADGSIDTVVIAFPDMHGRPVGKRVTADYFASHAAEHGIECCEYLLAVDVDMTPLPGYRFASWDTGYGDVVCHPDFSTARRIPWLDGTAWVIADLSDGSGAPVEVSPRQILRRQLERAAERGLRVLAATELEFYLFRDSYEEAAAKGWRGLEPHTSTIEDYQLLQTSREEYILRRIRNEMIGAGIPVEFSKGEAGRGQHEVNVTFDEALTAADRHLVFKNGIKEIAAQEGRAATFMAKWTMEDTGSSCHVHTSLWDVESGEPLMADATHATGLSVVGRQFLAGQLTAARELAWCAAPTVNSYRRYVPGSWAPTAVVWGEDNRTCGFRVVGSGAGRRVESRIPGADVNPYLVLAASVAAGLYGIDHELELGPAYPRNAYEATDVPRIPSTLIEAIDELRGSKVAVEAFGADVHHHLLNTAVQEWEASNRHVTDWELARYFERL